MFKMKKTILILSAIILTQSALSNDFLYKDRQSKENLTIYEKVITKNNIIEKLNIRINENEKTFSFKDLQHKDNLNNKYSGQVKVKNEGEIKDINLLFEEKEKNKKLILNIKTKEKESVVAALLSKEKLTFLNYLMNSKFNAQIKNESDTSYVFSMLDLENKNKLFETLKSLNSNKIKETLNIEKSSIESKEIENINYLIKIDNVLKISINSKAKIENQYLILENTKIRINVENEIDSLKEFEKIFDIDLSKGKRKKEIELLKIKI